MIEQEKITQAVELLKAGKLVAFPTETVYGLGADASNIEAIKKIFTAKGRPADHPLIVHIGSIEQIQNWAIDISPQVWELAKQYWPGPLTLIVKRAPHVSNLITGSQETVGIRIPSHPVAQALLKQFGGAIVAPSANRFGHVSPTQAEHVKQELGNRVDLILDGGACSVGIESTIIDVSGENPRLLRPGSILPSQLSKILGTTNLAFAANKQEENSTRASGMLESHYAPTTPLKIIEQVKLPAIVKELMQQDKTICVITYSLLPSEDNKKIHWFKMSNDSQVYAHELYATVRMADNQQADIILVEAIPNNEAWLAIMDRLNKAAAK